MQASPRNAAPHSAGTRSWCSSIGSRSSPDGPSPQRPPTFTCQVSKCTCRTRRASVRLLNRSWKSWRSSASSASMRRWGSAGAAGGGISGNRTLTAHPHRRAGTSASTYCSPRTHREPSMDHQGDTGRIGSARSPLVTVRSTQTPRRPGRGAGGHGTTAQTALVRRFAAEGTPVEQAWWPSGRPSAAVSADEVAV
jgi:hypothetical protein